MAVTRYIMLIALFAAGALLPFSARADAMPGHHGGQVQDAGPYHIELVAKPDTLTLYVTGSGGKKVETKGATGSATVLSGKARETVQLTPAGDNMLRGAGRFDLAKETKVVISVSFPGQSAVQARFTPVAAAEAPVRGGK